MFSIGEFSKISGLTVKAIRFYHEKQILIPAHIDGDSGYRFFDNGNVETAKVIAILRSMDFSVDAIKSILDSCNEDGDMIEQLKARKKEIEQNIKSQSNIAEQIDQVIKQHSILNNTKHQESVVKECELPQMLIGGIRMSGKYSDMGSTFSKLGRSLGRHIGGPPMCLYFDREYKEEDADFEPCFPIKKKINASGISIRELPACRTVSVKHIGPYDSLGSSYAKLFEYLKDNQRSAIGPSREVFIKGPGMIFKGAPRKYITEIQIVVS